MPEITVTVTAELAQELNEMAVELGYTNAKQMAIGWLRGKVLARRMEAAQAGVWQAAEDAAQQEVEGIG